MLNRATLIVVISSLLAFTTAHDHVRHHKQRKIAKRQQECEINEQYASSGFDCLTCKNYQNTICPIVNETKCYCLDGFVRDGEGNCISKTDCAKACGVHEYYTNKTPCEYKCGAETGLIPNHCNCTVPNGCVCDEKYVRCEETNTCVPQEFCYPICGKDETPFFNFCDPICIDKTVLYRPCAHLEMPCQKFCSCQQDFVRDGYSGACISFNQCIGSTTVSEPTSTLS